MTPLSSAGVDGGGEHPRLPRRDARSRLPQTGGGTHAAQGPVLGLRGRGECYLEKCAISLCHPERVRLFLREDGSTSV